jgi:energy-converting hydrogenase Eha subunit E
MTDNGVACLSVHKSQNIETAYPLANDTRPAISDPVHRRWFTWAEKSAIGLSLIWLAFMLLGYAFAILTCGFVAGNYLSKSIALAAI